MRNYSTEDSKRKIKNISAIHWPLYFFRFFLLFFEQEKRYPGIEDVSLHKTLAHDSIHPNIN